MDKLMPGHYTVDRLGESNRFVVELNVPCQSNGKSVPMIDKKYASLGGLHLLLKTYSRLGYIADRIAF